MNRAESLAAIRAEYERLSAEDGAVEGGRSHIFKLANMHELREAHEADNEIDNSGHPRVEQRQSQRDEMPRNEAEATAFKDRMQTEFLSQYGFHPSEEAVKSAAPGTDFFSREGRDAFYERVARIDGRQRQQQDDEPHRTSGTSGGRGSGGGLAQRVSDVLAAPRSTEDDNEMFLKGIAHMQQQRGWR